MRALPLSGPGHKLTAEGLSLEQRRTRKLNVLSTKHDRHSLDLDLTGKSAM